MLKTVTDQLAPSGSLRAALNAANFLLISGKGAAGEPAGIAPDLARAIADRLGVQVSYILYENPVDLLDAADSGAWDIGFIGADPKRAEKFAFTPAYAEIEATYLLPAGSKLNSFADVDRPGHRISVSGGTAYDLWLSRNIRHAELVRTPGLEESYQRFVNDGLDALAGLRPRLVSDLDNLPGARVIDGRYVAIQQAIGTARANEAAAAFLCEFVDEAKRTGLVSRLIERHNVRGLSVPRDPT